MKQETLSFPASIDGPWASFIDGATTDEIGTAKFVRTVAQDATSLVSLKKRTLTKLYNDRPDWLLNGHKALDEAVFAAYG